MINELSKAIAYFENTIQKSDKIIAEDCSTELASELTEQKKHFVVANDAMRLIMSDPVTALRLVRQSEDLTLCEKRQNLNESEA